MSKKATTNTATELTSRLMDKLERVIGRMSICPRYGGAKLAYLAKAARRVRV